ncbi:MAG TPA: hypothetical protein VGP48_10425 [Stellaceae bacterium]|jgi:hypothetical protein|nr:hypothetical protein [Stellaceae bacterium]
MARSNERPGRDAARDERAHTEPVLSFTPRDEFAEDSEPSLSGETTAPRGKPRAQAATAEDQEPRLAKAPKPAIAGAERPLYLYTPPPRRRPGVVAAKSVAVVGILALIGVYAWHRYAPVIGAPPSTADDMLPGLAQPQPLSSATYGAPDPSSLPTQEVAPAPVAQAPQPPPAAANPPPHPLASAPPPPAPAPVVNAAPKPLASMPAPQAPVAAAPQPAPPKHETVKRETPRQDAALDQSKLSDQAPPRPAMPAPAPATSVPSTPAPGPLATGQPRPLTQPAPPPQREAALPPAQQPSFAAPAPNAAPPSAAPDNGQATGPNTVTVDGVTYVNGQEPRALGTIGDANAPAANGNAGAPVFVPPQPTSADTMRPYVPRDTNDDVAPLPNDVIILPNGQMAVPSAQQ